MNGPQLLKELRTRARMTQQELAEALGGYDQSTVAGWESGRRVMGYDEILRADVVLGATGSLRSAFGYAAPTADEVTTIEDWLRGRGVEIHGPLVGDTDIVRRQRNTRYASRASVSQLRSDHDALRALVVEQREDIDRLARAMEALTRRVEGDEAAGG